MYGEDMLNIINHYAKNYIHKLKEYGLLSNFDNMESFNDYKNHSVNLSKLPFFIWLNARPEFKLVKEKLAAAKLITNLEATPPIKLLSSHLQYSAEFIIANAISNCVDHLDYLSNVVFVPVDWKRLPEKRFKELNLMSRNFELDSEAQLFIYLLNKLHNSTGSVYNSGTPHDHQARELLTKRFMQVFFYIFGTDDQSCTFIADIALDIIGIFFEAMKRDRAIKLAQLIMDNVNQGKAFMEKST